MEAENHYCSRCLELNIPQVTAWGYETPFPSDKATAWSSAVIQRHVIDPLVLGQSSFKTNCQSCRKLMTIHHLLRLYPDSVHRQNATHAKRVDAPQGYFKLEMGRLCGVNIGEPNKVHQQLWFEIPGKAMPWHERAPPKDINPEINWHEINSWLKDCQENHASCNLAEQRDVKGMRVIDVSTRRTLPFSYDYEYVALSFVWGRMKQPRCDGDDIPSELPQALEDAFTITRKLGKQYLWIDAFCVDQDNRERQRAQLGVMDAIYLNAFVTIIALDAQDANSHIGGMKEPRYIQTIAKFGEHTVRAWENSLSAEIAASTWHHRGWTYQEGLLSRRRLFFTGRQVYLLCNSSSYNEAWGSEFKHLPSATYSPQADEVYLHTRVSTVLGATNPALFDTYAQIASQYMTKTLTFESDTRPAALGLMSYLSRTTFAGNLLHGVPSEDLRGGLFWTTGQRDLKRRTERTKLCQKDRPVPDVPSWSWLAWKHPNAEMRLHRISFGERPFPQPPLNMVLDGEHLQVDPGHRPTVVNHRGTSLDVEYQQYTKELNARVSPGAPEAKRQQELNVLADALEHFWNDICSKRNFDNFNKTKTPGGSKSAILVSGVIITLPCMLAAGPFQAGKQSMYTILSSWFKHRCPHTFVSVSGHNELQQSRHGLSRSLAGAQTALGLPLFKDFLVIDWNFDWNSNTSLRVVRFGLLQLERVSSCWRERGGVCEVTVTPLTREVSLQEVPKALEQCKGRYEKFWLV